MKVQTWLRSKVKVRVGSGEWIVSERVLTKIEVHRYVCVWVCVVGTHTHTHRVLGVMPRFGIHSISVAFNGIRVYLPPGKHKPTIPTQFPN